MRRGVVWSAALSAVLLSDCVSSAAAPPGLMGSTVEVATHLAAGGAANKVLSAKVAVLTEGVLKAMFVTKLKTAAAVLLMVALVGVGGGATALFAGDEGGQVTIGVAVAAQAESPKKKAESDRPDINLKEAYDVEDGTFIRRTYLDLLGVLPTPEEVKQFQQDKAPDKRQRLVARLHVRVTMEDALKKLPDEETRRLALEEIEKLGKALKEKQPEAKHKSANLPEDLILDGKEFYDVSAAPGTSIKKSGEGVAIVSVKDGAKHVVSMEGTGTLYLIGTDDYSSVEVTSKTGDGDLVWVQPNPHGARIGPGVKGRIDGKGRIRSGALKEVNDLRNRQESRPGARPQTTQSLQDWLGASTRQEKPFDRLVRDYLARAKGATWEEWLDRAAYEGRQIPMPSAKP
jgi:hypothetical protein